jgi:LAS superfamily LD-carboxypeptidase LdcB
VALVNLANAHGIPARITSGYRTHAQQRALYRRYLAGMNPYPVAPPGTSDHEIGLAVDIYTDKPQELAILGRQWQSWGGVWSSRDAVHFTVR